MTETETNLKIPWRSSYLALTLSTAISIVYGSAISVKHNTATVFVGVFYIWVYLRATAHRAGESLIGGGERESRLEVA